MIQDHPHPDHRSQPNSTATGALFSFHLGSCENPREPEYSATLPRDFPRFFLATYGVQRLEVAPTTVEGSGAPESFDELRGGRIKARGRKKGGERKERGRRWWRPGDFNKNFARSSQRDETSDGRGERKGGQRVRDA